jgi:D-xylose transport system substrate-binding protein
MGGRRQRWASRIAIGASVVALAACSSGGASTTGTGTSTQGTAQGGLTGKVFMLLPNQTTSRYILRDSPDFVAEMHQKAPGVQVVVENADGDPTKQQSQAENAINQGAKLIILLAADQNLAGGILTDAKRANIPVLSYELMANGGPVTAAVIFNALAVGQNQGRFAAQVLSAMPGNSLPVARIFGNPGEFGTQQYLKGQNQYLQPLIDSGKIKVVCQTYTPNWDPTTAQNEVQNCLSKQSDHLAAVVVMNDGLALGSIAALTSAHLEGKIPVIGGQDGDEINMRYMLLGYQHDTEYKNIPSEADAAVRITLWLLSHPGQTPVSSLFNNIYNNGYEKVPAFMVPPTAVEGPQGVAQVVTLGGWTWPDVCQGPAAKTAVCAQHAS